MIRQDHIKTSLSENEYIVSFIDIYYGWPETFPVLHKSADNILHLILEVFYPRKDCPLQILTDNETKNVNKQVQETLRKLHVNINNIKISHYSPQGNGKVKRFHCVLHDEFVMAKKMTNNARTWDIYLIQTLAANRFHPNDSSIFPHAILCTIKTLYYLFILC